MEEAHRNFSVLLRMFFVVIAFGLVYLILIYLRSFEINTIFMKFDGDQQRQEHSLTLVLKNLFQKNNSSQSPPTPGLIITNHGLNICPETPPRLVGPLHVQFSGVSLDQLLEEGSVSPGGRFRPTECVSRQRVAIVIPFRDRELHLQYWLYYLHPILQRQQLDYGVYIIEQAGNTTFNRAKLMNVGYAEALKDYDYDCFVFSDVDIIPIDDRNIYKCWDQPRHLSVAIDKFNFQLPYDQIFGGITAMTKEQFQKMNGFSNSYWGWGGEDDDAFKRLSIRGMYISRPDLIIGRCKMIQHQGDVLNPPNPDRMNQLMHTSETMDKDGLNSLNYSVVSSERRSLYTRILVNIGGPPAL